MALSKMIVTDEDFAAVMDAIIFPMILSILQYDIKKMPDSELKIPIVYTAYLHKMQDYLTRELTVLHKEMRRLGIKILENNKIENGREYKYLCRGYQQTIVLLTDNIRTKVITRLCEILEIDLAKYGDTL